MKFARYLQDALTPEWKNAYIDYRGLKLQLRAIRAESPMQVDTSSCGVFTVIDLSAQNNERVSTAEVCIDRDQMTSPGTVSLLLSEAPTANISMESSDSLEPASATIQRMNLHGVLPLFSDPGSPRPSPLHALLSNLPPAHATFFDMLDAELAKVETFYSKKEKEMDEHGKLLRKQLHELGIHRQKFLESSASSKAQSWVKRAYLTISPALSSLIGFSRPKVKPKGTRRRDRSVIVLSESMRGRRGFVDPSHLGLENKWLNVNHSEKGATARDYSSEALDDFVGARLRRLNTLPGQPIGEKKHPFDPPEYQQAKRRLRKAVFEHYRGLEALNNYRVLNLAGFRKALRKYGKIANISVLDAYMKERVETTTFASGALVDTMLKEMEHSFAVQFERGDKRKAMDRLRAGSLSKTHHLSTLRSGMWLGLALPAVCAGTYLSFQDHTRSTLPSWNILVYIYSVFVVPVLLALLTGLNVVAWARNKINYVFIFELDPRSRLDYQEYFELPSFLLCTLAYAFWFSLAQLGPPMLWPLIWLTFTLVILFNPLRCLMWGRARWWTIRKMAKLATSGMWKVEFTDVWLGDLMCSLAYSFSNLYFVGCFYSSVSVKSLGSTENPPASTSVFRNLLASAYDPQAQTAWSTCGVGNNWGWYCLLGILPFLARFAQCMRRYRDAKLSAQLFNAGKYGMGMTYYIFYYYWRFQGMSSQGKSYALWCFVATLNSMYTYAWDIAMDWALCRPGAPYPLLRPELVYSSHIPWYYFAMTSNLVLRFIWLSYIFLTPGSAGFERAMVVDALLEMLRRVQWSFFRLENKHLNNMNLCRVTRSVPLPYEHVVDVDDEEALAQLQLRKRLAHLS